MNLNFQNTMCMIGDENYNIAQKYTTQRYDHEKLK